MYQIMQEKILSPDIHYLGFITHSYLNKKKKKKTPIHFTHFQISCIMQAKSMGRQPIGSNPQAKQGIHITRSFN